jgi:hypothetical protein
MTLVSQRSVEELRRESERTRAGLIDTVDQIRTKASDTAADIRERLSPDAIKAEVGDYFRTRGERLVDKARENPLQAAAIGVGLAYPLLGVVRSIPAPVLMIGAGLFLMGSKTGQSFTREVAGAASAAADRAGEGADALRRSAHDARDYAADRLAATSDAISAGVGALKQKVAGATDALEDQAGVLQNQAGAMAAQSAQAIGAAPAAARQIAGDAAARVQGAVGSAAEYSAETMAKARDQAVETAGDVATGVRSAIGTAAQYGAETAAAARDQAGQAAQRAATIASDTMQRHPLLIGGIGLAVGAFIAACLPPSSVEKDLMGDASDAVQNRARDLAAQGLDAAKAVASAAYDGAAERARKEGLTPDDLHEAAQDLGDKIRKVAGAASSAAFEAADENVH